jgi:ATP-dependent DNA helicase RecQ
MTKNYKAAYMLDSILDILDKKKSNLDKEKPKEQIEIDKINGLLQSVSSFDVQFPYTHQLNIKELNPILAILNNIITRGLPTFAPVFLEETFNGVKLTKPNTEEFKFHFPALEKKIEFETIFELLHIIKPQLSIEKHNYKGDCTDGEWYFLDTILKDYPFVKQILQSQRGFETINEKLIGGKTVDFSFEFPYLMGNLEEKGVIFEFDDKLHELKEHKYYDNYRDDAAIEVDFKTLRQRAAKSEPAKKITTEFKSDFFKLFEKNHTRNVADYLAEYTLIFVPLAVVRIQKTLIEHFLISEDLFKKEKIKIAIIERDLPCGALAIKGLQDLFESINGLLEENQLILPQIELSIFESKDWVYDEKLHLQNTPKDEQYFEEHDFDIIIDHAILIRSGIYEEKTYQKANSILVRSSHYFDTSFGNGRRVYCADLLKYKELVVKQEDTSYKAIEKLEPFINYFIQNIFRKKGYREGQLPIISRALQQKPVIGLLPTGGGKSLTYQLPALMQAGICLIVDPIKSLMEDQVRVLRNQGIDTCNYINSNLERKEKAKRLIDFRYGETQFMFVSPERFVMEDFRGIVKHLDNGHFGLALAYCVIDEVHCVSEWGHDFRSTYLMLGINAQKFCKTRNGEPVSLIGLTATASFDVLADIERELKIQKPDVANAIIMIENTIRPELFFRVIDVTGKDRVDELNKDFENVGKNLSKLNDIELVKKSIAHHEKWFAKVEGVEELTQNMLLKDKAGGVADLTNKTQNDFSSIVFCAVKGETPNMGGGFANKNGVLHVHQKLKSTSKGFYFATENKDLDKKIQESFVDFTTGNLQHMVCTKAFGMGIDKADIRSTYHWTYSSSLESLVQEAGRSGRDKKVSEATILVSKEKYFKLDVFKFFEDKKEKFLIKNKKFTRKAVRESFERKWIGKKPYDIQFPSLEELMNVINSIDFSLISAAGKKYNILKKADIDKLQQFLQEKDDKSKYKYIIEKYKDRDIHDYFYSTGFKGEDTERSQVLNLFKVKEFTIGHDNDIIFVPEQNSLEDTFNDKKSGDKFDFTIAAKKKYPKNALKVCKLLDVKPEDIVPFSTKTYQKQIESILTYSNGFNDFLFKLEEKNIITNLVTMKKETKRDLLFVYNRDREKGDTGRLIYRMHSMGFLVDYVIDYKMDSLHKCTFIKKESIHDYLEIIEDYLRRYLSENKALEEIEILKARFKNDTLIDNILECLYFLSEFSYEEIASKRKRATDEIEEILNKSITEKKYVDDWYEQNIYIKEQIYFYFNAKYARREFQIESEPYSLLDDYENTELTKVYILNRYLKVFDKDGTAQNNYKHMIGSCKKIMRSLTDSGFENEWLLLLLKAFAMYSVNNPSYIEEANKDLELGFDNIYKHENFTVIQTVFDDYFELLLENIEEQNISFKIIKQIRLKILQKLQNKAITDLIDTHSTYNPR